MGLLRRSSEMADKMTTALFGSAKTTKYQRPLVKIGSIVRMNYGPELNKLATVVNIIDGGRLLVDGPENLTGVPRSVVTLKRISLTGLEVNITREAKQRTLTKKWGEAGIQAKWDAFPYAKTIKRRATRASLNDFDRFKVMVARKARSVKVTAAFKKLKRSNLVAESIV